MRRFPTAALVMLVAAAATASSFAQSPAPAPADFDMLIKKLDEQNAKIDALSQQLLKLEQQISTIRPGVLIGEATPPPTASSGSAGASATSPAPTDSGNAHVVTKGETLTSIAKAHKVGVQELQKFNHIENDRALQIGQTIMLPSGASSPSPSASASPSASISASPSNE